MLQITPFKQTDDSRCGPACVKMVLDFYGLQRSEEEICKVMGHTYEQGCTDFQIKGALEMYGLNPIIKNNSSTHALRFWADSNVPTIVDWFTPGVNKPDKYSMPNGHSSIVLGVDEKNIVLMDPEIGAERVIDLDEFTRVWFDWRNHPFIQNWDDMVIRQAIPVYKYKR